MAQQFKTGDAAAQAMQIKPFVLDKEKYPDIEEKFPGNESLKGHYKSKDREFIDTGAFMQGSPYYKPEERWLLSNAGRYDRYPTFEAAYEASKKPFVNPFELSDENIRKDIRPYRDGSMSQEISSLYENLSDEYGLDLDNLVYGELGFMKQKYPEDFPDYAGDVVYSQKYWKELDDWFKENTGMSLADRKKYVEAKRKELYGV